MSGSGNYRPLMNASGFIRGAWPRGAAKRIERELGCSPRQAWRIASEGRVPGKFRAALLVAVHIAIEANQRELARLGAELKAIRHARMVARTAARSAASVGKAPRADQGRPGRSVELALKR